MYDFRDNSGFSLVVEHRSLPDFREWVFCPGMLFEASGKWWGKRGRRERPHEGLDLLLYMDGGGNIRHIDETFRVPILAEGFVAGIIDDFLGRSVIIEHPPFRGVHGKIVTIYGHTTPLNELSRGVMMKKGDIVANVAGRGQRSFTMSPHLHITIAEIPSGVSYDTLNWEIIGTPGLLKLHNPLDFINSPFRLAGEDDAGCIGASRLP